MKKILVMSALVAFSAAFVACSNENDLVQQAPEVPEVKGTPFSVMPSSGNSTRATLYNANAWDGTSDTYVGAFKLYGLQADASDPWLNSVVFTRTAKDGAWSANRDAANDALGDNVPAWPTTNTAKKTDFYGITDNAIGAGKGAAITGVSAWMSTPGSFVYTQPKSHGYIWDDENNKYGFEIEPDPVNNPDVFVDNVIDADYINAASLTDLMVATTTKAESETTGGVLPLNFKHLLAGLTIKVKFKSNDALAWDAAADVYAVMVRGLYTDGTYTFGTGWSNQSGDGVCYYKSFATPIHLDAEAETSSSLPKTLVDAGEWLVIPQTTTPWDETTDTEHFPGAKAGRQMAYVALFIHDVTGNGATDDPVALYFPLNTTFNAAKNRTITLEMSLGRDIWLDNIGDGDDPDGKADYQFEPSQTEGN